MKHMMAGAHWGDPCASWGASPFVLVHELEADPSSAAASTFAGAHGGRNAVVEYLVDTGASGPSIEVTVVSDGMTDNWTDSAPASGFHVHHLGHLSPGAKVTLTVAAAMARVRWCEAIWC
jgi:hypothetical protein